MFDFFMQEVLGMHWLSELVWLVLMDMGASQASPVWGGVHFFLYDIIRGLRPLFRHRQTSHPHPQSQQGPYEWW